LLEQLNAFPVAPAQIELAWAGREDAMAAAGASLQEEAVRARVTALASWTGEHDPHLQSNREALIAAAAHFSLSAGDDGFCFEPSGFQEMILFIEELPW
jgi:hypothetical protein